ncbi:MAG: hypothetical protein H3C47_11935 [Candidatus Cloacimonetes bacterium]|nr:hypothetical protein [Candidatus Cloacimonadota bacterium]
MREFVILTGFLIKEQLAKPASWAALSVLWGILAFIFGLVLEQTQQSQMSSVFWWTALISMFLAPILSMDLFKKQNRSAFFTLLRTFGISTHWLSLAFFLQKLCLFLMIDFTLLLMAVWLLYYGEPDPYILVSASIGLLGLQACYLGICMFLASLMDSAYAVLMGATSLLLGLWLLYYAPQILGTSSQTLGQIFQEASPYQHFVQFLNGAPRLSDVTFFAFLPALCLYLAGIVSKR